VPAMRAVLSQRSSAPPGAYHGRSLMACTLPRSNVYQPFPGVGISSFPSGEQTLPPGQNFYLRPKLLPSRQHLVWGSGRGVIKRRICASFRIEGRSPRDRE